jgi:hypothetical protein
MLSMLFFNANTRGLRERTESRRLRTEVSEKQPEKQPLFRSYRTPSIQARDRSKSADTPFPLPQSKKFLRRSSGYNLDQSSPEPETDEDEYGKIKETEKKDQDMDDRTSSECS